MMKELMMLMTLMTLMIDIMIYLLIVLKLSLLRLLPYIQNSPSQHTTNSQHESQGVGRGVVGDVPLSTCVARSVCNCTLFVGVVPSAALPRQLPGVPLGQASLCAPPLPSAFGVGRVGVHPGQRGHPRPTQQRLGS